MGKKGKGKVKLSAMTLEQSLLDDLTSRVPLPLDGGYSWVVMVASCVLNLLVDGVCYTFGLFNPEFIITFKSSKAKTAMVASVCLGSYMCFGEENPYSGFVRRSVKRYRITHE